MVEYAWISKLIIPWFILIAVSILLYLVSGSILAQVFLISTNNELQKIESDFNIEIKKNRFNAQHYFEEPMDYQKNNPAFYEGKGDFCLLLNRAKMDSISNRCSTVVAYRNAVNLAPAKAKYWTKLAYAKAISHQFDEEFYFAYQRAFYYGGWEYYINQTLMKIGMAYWYSMNVDSRLILKQAVIRSYLVRPRSVLDVAEQHGQLRMVCLWIRGENNMHKICERELLN